MPYYCTVPRCTSMAGKAKNVSFHQFPRDEELAQLWNNILKRGKPYTKYSKVCSLHFRPEDYTITSVGKNKGQWRTLRKDAIPSRNLPSESPPSQRRSRTWMPHHAPSSPSNSVDPQMQQSIAQLIYLQTMLAMQANNAEIQPNLNTPHGSLTLTEVERRIQSHNGEDPNLHNDPEMTDDQDYHRNDSDEESITKSSYKCEECSKCFKDPDVYKLHQRTHKKTNLTFEKENFNSNIAKQMNDKTLKANPILTNLLNNDVHRLPDNLNSSLFDNTNIETHIMQAFAANMESYINNLKSVLLNQNGSNSDNDSNIDDENVDEDSWRNENNDSTKNVDERNHLNDIKSDIIENNKSDIIVIEEMNAKCEKKYEKLTEINETNSGVSEKVSEVSKTDRKVDETELSEINFVTNETTSAVSEKTTVNTEIVQKFSETISVITETVTEDNEKESTILETKILANNSTESVSNHRSNSIDLQN